MGCAPTPEAGHSLISGESITLGERDLVYVIKDSDVRRWLWIILRGTQCNHRVLTRERETQRQAQGNRLETCASGFDDEVRAWAAARAGKHVTSMWQDEWHSEPTQGGDPNPQSFNLVAQCGSPFIFSSCRFGSYRCQRAGGDLRLHSQLLSLSTCHMSLARTSVLLSTATHLTLLGLATCSTVCMVSESFPSGKDGGSHSRWLENSSLKVLTP